MRKAFVCTAMIWIVVAISLSVQALLAVGLPVPLLRRSSAWEIATQPWIAGALAAIGAVTVLLMRFGPGPDDRRRRALGWTLGLVGVGGFLLLEQGVSFLLIGTGRLVYTGGPQLLAPPASGRTPVAT